MEEGGGFRELKTLQEEVNLFDKAHLDESKEAFGGGEGRIRI